MTEEITYFINTLVAIFVIVDPFAVIPVYLILTERFSDSERRAICRKSAVIASIVLLTFAITGLSLFRFFGISMSAFQIAGGILLMTLGVRQLNSTRKRVTKREEEEGLEKEDISIFPLATPLLAGPGAISTVVLYSSKATTVVRQLNLLIAVGLVLASCYICLRGAPLLYRILGSTGLNLITRIMGIILTAIGVQFIINGLKATFSI